MEDASLDRLIIGPDIWPNKKLHLEPGDFSQYASKRGRFDDSSLNSLDPIKSDPPYEESYGTIFFGNELKKQDFLGFLRMVGIYENDKDYLAFVKNSKNPKEDRYFKQLRLVSKFALMYEFGALNQKEYKDFKKQDLTIPETLWNFIQIENKRTETKIIEDRIEGKMGGNGDDSMEKLCFGFMVESDRHSIYRIWSRAKLVTK